MDIKPIETHYNGFRFRSRLEARWAVFFDAANIEYDYEVEGFELGEGKRYLPDFYLPKFKTYVEIKRKGLPEIERKEAKQKCESLLLSKDGVCALYLEGDPVDCIPQIYCYEGSCGGGGVGWHNCYFAINPIFGFGKSLYVGFYSIIVIDPDCGEVKGPIIYGDGTRLCYLNSNYEDVDLVPKNEYEYGMTFETAKLKARQARFEHGENPKP